MAYSSWLLRLASCLTNLCNVRVIYDTRIPTTRALAIVAVPSPFLYTTLPSSASSADLIWSWFCSMVFVFLDFMHGVQARRYHSGTHSASLFVSLDFVSCFCCCASFSAIINTLGHRLLYRQTNLGGWTTSFAAIPCCWRTRVVSSISSCIGLYVYPAVGWSTCAWVNLFVDGSIGLSLMIASISVTNQNWSRAVYLNYYPSCYLPL